MLKNLALKHDLWVRMARGLCKDNYLADDLVSEMYLKLSEYTDKDLNDYYVYYAIKHIYINQLRDNKKRSTFEMSLSHLQENDCIDIEAVELYKQIDFPDCLTWVEKQILLLRQNHSGRDIQKQYHINYVRVHRIEKQAKQKLSEWAKQLEGPATL